MTPMPVPTPFADMRAYLLDCAERGMPLEAGLYLYSGTLHLTRHGMSLIGAAGLPSRAAAGSLAGGYGVVLRETSGAPAAVLVGAMGAYISNIEIAGLRIESTGGEALHVINAGTSTFDHLALIGTGGGESAGRAVLHVSGGIGSRFAGIDVSGMGHPEFVPHGDFGQRAAYGVLFDGGTDEWGAPTLGNAHTVERLYVHQCCVAIFNDNSNVMLAGGNIIEECLQALRCGATSRTTGHGLYWEAVGFGPFAGGRAPIRVGRHASLIVSELDGKGSERGDVLEGDSASPADAWLTVIVSGSYLKNAVRLVREEQASPAPLKVIGSAIAPGLSVPMWADVIGCGIAV